MRPPSCVLQRWRWDGVCQVGVYEKRPFQCLRQEVEKDLWKEGESASPWPALPRYRLSFSACKR